MKQKQKKKDFHSQAYSVAVNIFINLLSGRRSVDLCVRVFFFLLAIHLSAVVDLLPFDDE